MLIAEYTKNDFDDWQNFVVSSAQSTVYHTIQWKEFWEAALPHTACYLMARDEHSKICGVLPSFYLSNIFGKRIVSMPLRDKGGCLSLDDAVSTQLLQHLVEVGKKFNVRHIELKGWEAPGFTNSLVKSHVSISVSQNWISSVITLPKDSKMIWDHLENNATGPIKQAQKQGVVVSGESTIEGMMSFSKIFYQCRKRLGVPSYDNRFFTLLFQHLVATGKAKIFLAFDQGRPIAGMILLLHRETVTDGYAASLEEYKHLRANDLLIWEALKWSIQAGYTRFDFGADSPLQKGLLAFKKKWGAEQHPLSTTVFQFSHKKPVLLDSDQGKYRCARMLFKKMPRFLYKIASKGIISRIG